MTYSMFTQRPKIEKPAPHDPRWRPMMVNNTIRIKSDANYASPPIMKLYAGDSVMVMQVNSNWAAIMVEGSVGFCVLN